MPTKFLPWSGSSTPAWYLFPHTLDLATWYSGQKVESVYATGTKKLLKSKGIDTYDTIHAIFKLTNGVTVQLLSSFVLPEKLPLRYDFKIDVIGEKGGLYMNTHDQMVHEIADSYSHVSVLVHPLHGMLVGPPTQMLYSFIEHVRKEIPIEANEIAGRANTAAVAAAHRSIIEGNPIKL